MEDIRKGVCPLCRHNEIAQMVPTTMPGYGESNELSSTVYICTRCCFAQTFVYGAAAMKAPFWPVAQLIKGPEPAGPYR